MGVAIPTSAGLFTPVGALFENLGIEALPPPPPIGDFNEDLVAFGLEELRAIVRSQGPPTDVERFDLAAPSGRL